jgi:hypothetical protein
VHLTCGSLRHFQALSTLKQNPALEVLSTPTHTQVTQSVGQLKSKEKNMETLNLFASWAQILSLPIAIIAILVSIWLYFKSKQRRAIACIFDQIESPIEIKAGKALDGAIEILYKGKPVKNIFLVRFKIRNIGNIPIRQSDVINPVTFTFEPNVMFLREPRVIEQKPSNLKTKWSLKKTENSSKEISFLFDLLNPGDEVSAEFLCAGDAKLPNITARIEGVHNIDALDPEEKRLKHALIEALGIPIVVILFLLLQKYFSVSNIKVPEPLGVIIGILFVIVVLAVFALMAWVQTLRPVFMYIKYLLKKNSKKV